MLSFTDFLLILFVLSLLFCLWWYGTMPSNLPPGPRGFPLFGSMFDTWKAADLHTKLHQWTQVYGPVFKLYVADKLVVVLGDWDTLHEGMVKQGDAYAGRPQVFSLMPEGLSQKYGLMGSEGHLWKTQRRFAISTLRDFGIGRSILEPRIKQEVEYLMDEFGRFQGRPFDPSVLLNNAIANVICSLVFNRRFEYSRADFAGLLAMLRARLQDGDVSLLTPFILSERIASIMARTPQVKRFKNDRLQVAQFLHREIVKSKEEMDDELKRTPLASFQPTSYVQAFYKSQLEHKDDPESTFSDSQLMVSVLNLFVAGTDSTATTLRWGLFYLARNPELQEKLYREIKERTGSVGIPNNADRVNLPWTEATIMEVQRIGNLTPLGVLRRTNAPTKIRGYDIPEDTIVVPLLTAVLFDPKVYPNPFRFDPTRFMAESNNEEDLKERMSKFVPFQLGKRVCLGESLARMELFLFFTGLLMKYQFSYDPDEPIPSEKGITSFNRAPVKFNLCARLRTEG